MNDAARPAADGLVVPPPNRRPRVREVSSRFLSSSSLSTPGGEDVQIRPPVKSSKQFGAGVSTPITRRSCSDYSPLGSHNYCYTDIKESKQQRGAAVKLFKENKSAVAAREGKGEEQQLSDGDSVVLQQSEKTATTSTGTSTGTGTGKFSSSRPDTPITTATTGTGKYSSSSRPDTPITTTTSTGTGKSSLSSRPDTPITTTGTGYITTVNGTGTGNGKASSSRLDTPITAGTNRIVPSRFRQLSTSSSQNFHPSQTNKLIIPASAAAKLLQSSGLSTSAMGSHCLVSDEAKVPISSSTIQEEEGLGCSSKTFPNSPISQNNSRTRSLNSDTRSSMPDTRLLLAETSSSNSIVNNVSDSHLNLKFSACSRSLNLPLSNSVKMMGVSLSLPPPHPAHTKLGPAAADVARKGRKIFTHQEQVHSLRLLHNNCLQWRFANAKAEASLRSQTSGTEIKLHSLGVKISDMRDVVERKRIELGLLQRTKTLSTIIETHMPYLDEWSALEEEYSTSLSATTHALSNSLVRLPVSGNVQADTREVGESLNSAIKVMEMIGIHVQSFMPKANEMDTLITELARLVGGERVLIEECGDLLFKTFTSQVEDCSLRGHLMQLQNNNQVPTTTGVMEELSSSTPCASSLG